MVKNNIMKRIIFSLAAIMMAFGCFNVAAQDHCASDCGSNQVIVKTGIDVLVENNFKQLEGKRVGLVTNPTGIDRNLVSTIDILHNAKNVELVALYGPEHGVRGDIHAGAKVEDYKDPATGIPVYSIYGKTRKPTPEMLKGIDAMIYDIQDNGCRSYTFISTLGLLMEACAEQGIEVIVLDRPNPLSGLKVEGNLVEPGYFSFVSMFEIPYIYGLTVGELATMLNEEGMLKGEKGTNTVIPKCKLTVIPMEGWTREMVFADTKLPWVLPSPHVPYAESAYYYPASGILGELYYLNIGIGYTLPFQLFAAEWITSAEDFSAKLNSYKLPGVKFRPIQINPFYGGDKGKQLQGVQFFFTDFQKAAITDIQFVVIEALAEMYPDHAVFGNSPEGRFSMFDKVTGSDYIRKNLSKRHKFSDIKDYWYKDVDTFIQLSKKYYRY